MRQSAAEAGAHRQGATKQIAGIKQKIAGIVRAIEDGAYNAALGDRLTELEAEQKKIEDCLAQLSQPSRVA